jgi:hypothetical protein
LPPRCGWNDAPPSPPDLNRDPRPESARHEVGEAAFLSHHAPRSLLVRPTITLEVYLVELHNLIELLTARAVRALKDPDQVGCADYLFQRIAALREAGR